MIASNQTFVIAAYVITWLVLLGYVARLAWRDARARATHKRASGQART